MSNLKKILIGAAVLGGLFLSFGSAYAITPFISAQVGTSPASGTFLETNGITSTWQNIPTGSGSVGPAASSEVAVFNSSTTVTGSSTFTTNPATGEVLVQNIETIVFADQFTGSDMDAQIQAAYNSCPSNGCMVVVPTGFYNVSSSVVIGNIAKVLNLYCPAGGGLFDNGGTTFNYTPSNGGAQFTYDAQDFVSAGTGITNCNFIGPAGSGNTGSSNTTSSTAIFTGGFTGAVVSAVSSTDLVTYTLPSYTALINTAPVSFSGGSLPGGISAGTTYYIGNITNTTFKLFTTQSLVTGVNITGSGSGSFTPPNGTGAFGFTLQNVHISGFGTGVLVGNNTSFLTIANSVINKNGQDLFEPQLGGANGENMRAIDSVFADANNALFGQSISRYCVNIQLSGNVQWSFTQTSFDDCELYQNQSGGTSNIIKLTDDHFENPNTGGSTAYNYITMLAGQPQDSIISSQNDYMQDLTSSAPTQFVLNGGQFSSSGDTVELNNNVNTPMSNFVTNQDSNDVVSWTGLTQGFANTGASTAINFVVGATPYSSDGLQIGNSAPLLSVTPGSGSTSIGRVNIQDLNNYLYVPTTFATTGCAGNPALTDFGACVNGLYNLKLGLASSVEIIVPFMNVSYATPIVFGNNGERADLVGTAGEGTTLTYTGTGPAITLNYGIQSTGVSHTIGQGVGSINLMGNNTATSSPLINSQIGILVGGNFGAAGTVLNDVDVSGFGVGIYSATSTYNFTSQDSLIRNNGENVYIAPSGGSTGSGEAMRFLNDFIVDGANHNPFNCFSADISSAISLDLDGTSLDDCQLHIGQATNVVMTGGHMENPGFSGWGSYDYIVVDQNASAASNLDINGTTFVNSAPSSTAPVAFILNGGHLTLNGVVVRSFGATSTINSFVTSQGTGNATPFTTWSGFDNVGNNTVNNVVDSLGLALNGTTGASTFDGLISVVSASSTILVGTGGTNPGCIESFDVVNSSTKYYSFVSSGIWTTTSTQPLFCK